MRTRVTQSSPGLRASGWRLPVRGTVVWAASLLLLGDGLLANNPGAVLLAQVGWACLMPGPTVALWRRMPGSAIAVLAAYISAGELVWCASRVGLLADGRPLSSAVPSIFSGALAAASAACLRTQWMASQEPSESRRRRSSAPLVLCLVAALTWPAVRPGAGLRTASFAIRGAEYMHNLARAAAVERHGYIPYGPDSPANHVVDDYYPRGFHLVADWLNIGVGNYSGVDTQAWVLGYLRVDWVVWALLMLSLAAAAAAAWRRTMLAFEPPLLALLAPGIVLLGPTALLGIVLVGFSSFALGVAAVAVSFVAYLEVSRARSAVLVCLAAFVVASHGWLVLAGVPLVLAAARVALVVAGAGRPVRPMMVGRVAAMVVPVVLAVGLSARPWFYTFASGDAGQQAREPGAIASPSEFLVWLTLIGLALLAVRKETRALLTSMIVPLIALSVLVALAYRAVDGDVDLYYFRKLVWAIVLLLCPVCFVGHLAVLHLLVSRAASPRAWRMSERAVAPLLVAALLMTDRVSLEPWFPGAPTETTLLAERAVDAAPDYQLITVGVTSPELDRVASMWGRAGRDIRGIPSFDVSEWDFATSSAETLCAGATGSGIVARVVTRSAGELVERSCS